MRTFVSSTLVGLLQTFYTLVVAFAYSALIAIGDNLVGYLSSPGVGLWAWARHNDKACAAGV
jgi:hypothetical protein